MTVGLLLQIGNSPLLQSDEIAKCKQLSLSSHICRLHLRLVLREATAAGLADNGEVLPLNVGPLSE